MNPARLPKENRVRRTIVKHHAPPKSHRHASDVNQVQVGVSAVMLSVLALLMITVWAYWPIGKGIFIAWQTDDDYSAGQLVPLVALFLLWRERKTLAQCDLSPCWAGGIALLLLAEAAQISGLLAIRPSVERYALVLTMAGLVLIVAGWKIFRHVFWILLILFLMVPLPAMVHNRVSVPFRNVATTGSVFLLEALGATVSQQGNVIMLNDEIPMAVAEACSGLRLLTAFVIVAAFVTYMVKRSRLQKALLLLSSVPVAVMCNILRLVVTAGLFMLVSAEVGQKFFHDFAGLAMMPIAALLLFAEIRLIDILIVPETNLQDRQTAVHPKSGTKSNAKRRKRRSKHVTEHGVSSSGHNRQNS